MALEPEWHQGQPVPDGYAVVAKLGRLWAAVPAHERATKADWTRSAIPKPGAHMWASYERIAREPQCEIAVSTLHLTEWRSGLWVPCQSDTYDDGTRCSRHGGPRKARAEGRAATREAVADLQRENEELRRQLRLLTVSNAGLTSIAEKDPAFAHARAAVDGLTS